MGHGPQIENHWFKGCALCDNWTLKTGNELKKLFSKLDFQKLTKILINQCYFRTTKMLTQLTDLRLCALMSLSRYVPAPLCLRSYVADRECSFWWPCFKTLIRVIWEEGTMASAEIALVCGVKVRVGCQDRLCVNSGADCNCRGKIIETL